MSQELTHDTAFVALGAAALDMLDKAETTAVLSHAAACPICWAELNALREVSSNLAFAAPLASPATSERGERIRARLMTKARSRSRIPTPPAGLVLVPQQDPEKDFVVPAAPPALNRPTGRGAQRWAMAASILFVAAAGLSAWLVRDRMQLHHTLDTERVRRGHAGLQADSLRAVVHARDSMIEGLAGKNVAVMRLAPTHGGTAWARMFWDQERDGWTFVAHDVPAVALGRTYQVWLITTTAKISAGTFNPESGEGMLRATYALKPAELIAVVVTEEPLGGSAQPTGATLMSARANY